MPRGFVPSAGPSLPHVHTRFLCVPAKGELPLQDLSPQPRRPHSQHVQELRFLVIFFSPCPALHLAGEAERCWGSAARRGRDCALQRDCFLEGGEGSRAAREPSASPASSYLQILNFITTNMSSWLKS